MATVPDLKEAPNQELALPEIDIEAFEAVPEHGGNMQALIERFGNDLSNCPFINSLGDAGIKLAHKMAEAEKNPEKGLTLREILEAKRQATQASESEKSHQQPKNNDVVQEDIIRVEIAAEAEVIDRDDSEVQVVEAREEHDSGPRTTIQEAIRISTQIENDMAHYALSQDMPIEQIVLTTQEVTPRLQEPAMPVQTTTLEIIDPTEISSDQTQEEPGTEPPRFEREEIIEDVQVPILFPQEVASAIETVIFNEVIVDNMQNKIEVVLDAGEVPVEALNPHVVELVEKEPPLNVFQEFVESQILPDEPVTFESVQAQANQLPLEDAFLQLAIHFLETTEIEANGEYELSEDEIVVKQLLQEICEDLVQTAFDGLESRDVQLTPEMTQKVLLLLSLVGYENPKKVLAEFVTSHDVEFLLQVVQYLGQLTGEDDRREILLQSVSLSDPLIIEEPSSVRIGRAIVRLVRTKFTPSEIMIAA